MRELTTYEQQALQAMAMDAASSPAVAQVLAGLLVLAAHPEIGGRGRRLD